MRYKEKQINYFLIILYLFFILFILYLSNFELSLSFYIFLIIFLILLILFYDLNIVLDEEKIELKYGLGFISRKIYLKDIKNVEIVSNKDNIISLLTDSFTYDYSYYDNYSVFHLKVIKLELKDNSEVRIGSKNLQKFYEIIKTNLNLNN